MMMNEEWRPVVGYEGLYEVSNMGRVRSLDRILPYQRIDQYSGKVLQIDRYRKAQMLRPGRKPSGHVSVALGRKNSRDVHILVLEAFVGPCPPGEEGLHENDVPNDNRLENLSWGTRSKNLYDAVRNGKKPVGSAHRGSKLTEDQVREIRSKISEGKSCLSISRDYPVGDYVIRQIRDKRTWKHVD